MWAAKLIDDSMVGYPSNFLEINQPIRELIIPKAKVSVKDCHAYYMVFHAIAAVGQQGRVEAIEIGGLTKGGEYCGVNLARSGAKEEKRYTAASFPYRAALKPGSEE